MRLDCKSRFSDAKVARRLSTARIPARSGLMGGAAAVPLDSLLATIPQVYEVFIYATLHFLRIA
jgi:hypothetical protein